MKFRHYLSGFGAVLVVTAPIAPLLTGQWPSIIAIGFLGCGALCISLAAIITPTEGD